MRRLSEKFDTNYPHISDFCGEVWASIVVTTAITVLFTVLHAIWLHQFDLLTPITLLVGSVSVFVTILVFLAALYVKESPRRLNVRRAWAELFWTRVHLPAVDHRALTDIVSDDYYATGNTFWFRDRNEGLRVKMCSGIGGGDSA